MEPPDTLPYNSTPTKNQPAKKTYVHLTPNQKLVMQDHYTIHSANNEPINVKALSTALHITEKKIRSYYDGAEFAKIKWILSSPAHVQAAASSELNRTLRTWSNNLGNTLTNVGNTANVWSDHVGSVAEILASLSSPVKHPSSPSSSTRSPRKRTCMSRVNKENVTPNVTSNASVDSKNVKRTLCFDEKLKLPEKTNNTTSGTCLHTQAQGSTEIDLRFSCVDESLLQGKRVGEAVSVRIQAKATSKLNKVNGGDTFIVQSSDPAGFIDYSPTVIDNLDGTYDSCFKPKCSGDHQLSVWLCNREANAKRTPRLLFGFPKKIYIAPAENANSPVALDSNLSNLGARGTPVSLQALHPPEPALRKLPFKESNGNEISQEAARCEKEHKGRMARRNETTGNGVTYAEVSTSQACSQTCKLPSAVVLSPSRIFQEPPTHANVSSASKMISDDVVLDLNKSDDSDDEILDLNMCDDSDTSEYSDDSKDSDNSEDYEDSEDSEDSDNSALSVPQQRTNAKEPAKMIWFDILTGKICPS